MLYFALRDQARRVTLCYRGVSMRVCIGNLSDWACHAALTDTGGASAILWCDKVMLLNPVVRGGEEKSPDEDDEVMFWRPSYVNTWNQWEVLSRHGTDLFTAYSGKGSYLIFVSGESEGRGGDCALLCCWAAEGMMSFRKGDLQFRGKQVMHPHTPEEWAKTPWRQFPTDDVCAMYEGGVAYDPLHMTMANGISVYSGFGEVVKFVGGKKMAKEVASALQDPCKRLSTEFEKWINYSFGKEAHFSMKGRPWCPSLRARVAVWGRAAPSGTAQGSVRSGRRHHVRHQRLGAAPQARRSPAGHAAAADHKHHQGVVRWHQDHVDVRGA